MKSTNDSWFDVGMGEREIPPVWFIALDGVKMELKKSWDKVTAVCFSDRFFCCPEKSKKVDITI